MKAGERNGVSLMGWVELNGQQNLKATAPDIPKFLLQPGTVHALSQVSKGSLRERPPPYHSGRDIVIHIVIEVTIG